MARTDGHIYEDHLTAVSHLFTAESRQLQLAVNIPSMLDDEIGWLNNFVPSEQTRDTDNMLLAGHLRLIHTLLTCEGVDKREIGEQGEEEEEEAAAIVA